MFTKTQTHCSVFVSRLQIMAHQRNAHLLQRPHPPPVQLPARMAPVQQLQAKPQVQVLPELLSKSCCLAGHLLGNELTDSICSSDGFRRRHTGIFICTSHTESPISKTGSSDLTCYMSPKQAFGFLWSSAQHPWRI